MLGRSKTEGGRREGKEEEGEVEEEARRVENEVMNAILSPGPIESHCQRRVAAVVEESNAERGSGGDVADEPFQHLGQSWDCSQMEDELEERDATDWIMDDEMIRQWEEVCKVDERITRIRGEGRVFKVEGVQSVLETVVTQA